MLYSVISAHEYTYIVDGANVAYNRQNFHKGKFSYSQIELVVNKLLERNDGKVLVLMPYPYAQKVVPNSSKQKGKRNITFITENDQRILKRFEDERMMYVVPPGKKWKKRVLCGCLLCYQYLPCPIFSYL